MSRIKAILQSLRVSKLVQKDSERAVRAFAQDIASIGMDFWLPVDDAAYLLGASVPWLREYSSLQPEKGRWSFYRVQRKIRDSKAHSWGGKPESHKCVVNLREIRALLRRFLIEINHHPQRSEEILAKYDRLLLFELGDRLLTRDELVRDFHYPISRLNKGRRLVPPVDLSLGQNTHRPFLRYPREKIRAKLHLWQPEAMNGAY